MFTSPEFYDLINTRTLRFRLPVLESAFQAQKEKDYINGKGLTYLALFTLVAIMVTSIILSVIDRDKDQDKYFYNAIGANVVFFIGLASEFLICITNRFIRLRTIGLCLCTFVTCAMFNSFIETTPTFRPGYPRPLLTLLEQWDCFWW